VRDKPDPFEEPSRRLRSRNPGELAESSGAHYSEGRLILPFLAWEIVLEHPSLDFWMPDFLCTYTLKLLTLLYLDRADGTPLASHWVPYRELSDGLFYSKNFSETVEERMRTRFAAEPESLLDAAVALGGEPVEQGDAGVMLRTFPRIPLLIILWKQDEEFPAACNILFDASSTHYLNAFELKMLSGEMASRIIAVADGRLSL